MDAGDWAATGRRVGAPTDDEFEQFVTDMRANGGNILVTGEVSRHAATTAARRLFGSTEVSRKRILAVTNSAIECPDAFLPEGVTTDDPDVWLIDQRDTQRSISAIPEVADADLPSLAAGDDLDVLRRDITEAISSFAKLTDLGPCELRLSVNSLAGPLSTHGLDAIQQFLAPVLPLVTAHDGMAHYFLPLDADDDRIDALRPLFDARIELQKRADHPPEQRWHLPGYDHPTRWLTFTTDR